MNSQKNKFGLLGTAIAHGQPKPGVDKAYEYLELVGFWDELKKDFDFENFGSLSRVKPELAYNNLYKKTLEILKSNHRPFLIGGDHSQAVASIGAVASVYPDLKVLWIDAHPDLNTLDTSPSGNTHGMPVSGLLGLLDTKIWHMPSIPKILNANQIIQFGIRDIDAGELRLLKELNVEYYRPEKIKGMGLQNILDDICERWMDSPLHLSFDIDGLDETLIPATGTPVPEGLSMEEAQLIIDTCKNNFNLVSCEVVEFNPDLAKTSLELTTTEKNVKEIIKQMLNC
jgi:arginase